ncbi:MAG: hypothetical protein AB1642_11330 [Pseudomonadota bacterium]
MPLDPITSAIVSSVIGSAIESALTPAPQEPAYGIVRMMPEESRRGLMLPPAQWEVRIDGKTYPLSPGAQFRDALNMIVMPSMIQQPVKVRFMTDYSGAVHRVWILSAAEASLPENR